MSTESELHPSIKFVMSLRENAERCELGASTGYPARVVRKLDSLIDDQPDGSTLAHNIVQILRSARSEIRDEYARTQPDNVEVSDGHE